MPLPRLIKNTSVAMRHDWPAEMLVQGGESGVVFVRSENRSYRTAFVEAFPGGTFLRGEGESISDAENQCWEFYEKLLSCGEHGPYERRHYVNGSGYCTKCGTWFSKVFEPIPQEPKPMTDWEVQFWQKAQEEGMVDPKDPEFQDTLARLLNTLAYGNEEGVDEKAAPSEDTPAV